MAHLSSSKHNQSAAMASPNFIDGYWFYFNDGDTDIAVNGSAWSGKETVYVNDNPVSSKRELLKTVSEHHFVHNGHKYLVRYHITSLMRGNLECEVFKNGELLASQSKAFVSSSKRSWLNILKMFAFGFLFGLSAVALVKYLVA
ncbi:MAG: hypothetical protein SWN10_21630 [Pseudomonadota bacterium]|uniref:Uncharacterized protein n=1 Tax=Alteromonas alba TaxID=2079529 RepID=A0A2S9V902_9ALTE|nr:hypothetical protein [Alteromonas alba]MDY6929686.1 hypothetical protein [Pseudomonadota bacterium]PRO72914.1 hypothetical protein C6Y40_14030 [Alteromonas alba]RPH19813.1 MAG: hypothetical protein CBB67_007730 [Alteromonadaceae bacterium TMED7]|tara:strand:+ start:47436 stop:47867 length:432 start_codon:yes stop_codon:yes gene_type:complete